MRGLRKSYERGEREGSEREIEGNVEIEEGERYREVGEGDQGRKGLG